MKALIVDHTGESRELPGIMGFNIGEHQITLMDLAGLHVYPANSTALHLQPETESDTRMLVDYFDRL